MLVSVQVMFMFVARPVMHSLPQQPDRPSAVAAPKPQTKTTGMSCILQHNLKAKGLKVCFDKEAFLHSPIHIQYKMSQLVHITFGSANEYLRD